MLNKAIIIPEVEAIAALKEAWNWLLPEDCQPLLFTAIGDMFYKAPSGEVCWLDTALGEIEAVSNSTEEFQSQLNTEMAEQWLLPSLIEDLIAQGKVLQPGQCYGFVILPIFKGGSYAAENMYVIRAKEAYSFTGDIHRQIQDVPDGGKVRLRVTD